MTRLRTRAEQIADELGSVRAAGRRVIADNAEALSLLAESDAAPDVQALIRDCARCGATHGGSSCMAAARAAHKKVPAPHFGPRGKRLEH